MKWNDPIQISINIEKDVRNFYKEVAKNSRESFNATIEKALEKVRDEHLDKRRTAIANEEEIPELKL